MAEEEKKIIVDDDWKQEAQREKEVLAAKEKAEKEAKETEEEQPQESQGRGPMPEGNLAALISMLATQSLFAMGLLQIKGQEGREPDLEMAKYNIDMLDVIVEKTKGNLTEEEEQVLSTTLSELRMGYVRVAG